MQTHELLVEMLVVDARRRDQIVYLVRLLLYFLRLRHVHNAAVHHLVVESTLISAHRRRAAEPVVPLFGRRSVSAK